MTDIITRAKQAEPRKPARKRSVKGPPSRDELRAAMAYAQSEITGRQFASVITVRGGYQTQGTVYDILYRAVKFNMLRENTVARER